MITKLWNKFRLCMTKRSNDLDAVRLSISAHFVMELLIESEIFFVFILSVL